MYRLLAALGGLALGGLVFWRVRSRRRARCSGDAPLVAEAAPADRLREKLSDARADEREQHEPDGPPEGAGDDTSRAGPSAGGNGQPAAPVEVERRRVHERAREAARRMRPDQPASDSPG
ncbi:MAG: hypothetical protein ACE5EV_02620 [Gaiellales bacterium]